MDQLKNILAFHKNKTIELAELEKLIKNFYISYEEFARDMIQLEETTVLTMVKSKGRTHRSPSLAFAYRINKNLLKLDYHKELQKYRRIIHPSINLDSYYSDDPSVWKLHLPYLMKINNYIMQSSFPIDSVPAPERSYELVGDEKWIVEKGGKEILDRIGIYQQMKLIPVSEPLMFALNPSHLQDNQQYHLIVENKTTYQGLLPALIASDFSTLIYGSGKAVVKSIEQFPLQYPITSNHHFFYFGDIDKEGISIWYSLNQRQSADLALPFYLACLQKEPSIGKGYQKERSDAIDGFMSNFSLEEQSKILTLLKSGYYYPQETLKTKELQKIWRETDWKGMIYRT